jgi:chromosome segregation ATPase
MKLATTLFVLGVIAICLALAILLAKIILKIVATAKSEKKKETDSTPAPVDIKNDDNKSAAETVENGDGTTSNEKPVTPAPVDEKPCPEKGALAKAEAAAEAAKAADEKAEAADKKATEAAEAAKAADEKAEAADKKAEANAEAISKMQHEERMAKNAEDIRLVEGVIALKRTELAHAQEALHFANDDQIDLTANAKSANKALVNAGSAKNNASHKHAAAVEAKSDAEIAVANATLENAGEDALEAANADLILATENVDVAFADLQAATDAFKKAKAAKDEADKAVTAKSNEIVATKAKIAELEKEIKDLEAKLNELKA